MTKLPRYTDDPQEQSIEDVVHDDLWSKDSQDLVEMLDRYVGRDKWLNTVEDRYLYDICDALIEEAKDHEAESQMEDYP